MSEEKTTPRPLCGARTALQLGAASALILAAVLAGCGPRTDEAGLHPSDAHRADGVLRNYETDMGAKDANRGTLTLEGGPSVEPGKITVDCGPTAGQAGFRIAYRTPGDSPVELSLLLHGYDGEGTYPAEATLSRVGDDGTLLESSGEAQVTVTETSERAGRHSATGSFEGSYAGAAGKGTANGRFTRCFFFQ